MDQRWSERIPVNLEVLLDYPSLGLIRAKARDINLNGMFIDTGQIALAADEALAVTFVIDGGIDKKPYNLKAKVIHTANRGVGVRFWNLDAETAQSIKKFVYLQNAHK